MSAEPLYFYWQEDRCLISNALEKGIVGFHGASLQGIAGNGQVRGTISDYHRECYLNS